LPALSDPKLRLYGEEVSDTQLPLLSLNSTREILPSLSLALADALTVCVVKNTALLTGLAGLTDGATLGGTLTVMLLLCTAEYAPSLSRER
jgi:hypothetical protein